MIKMRPHHSVCLQFFAGKGYSCGFVENMMRIKHSLDSCGGTEIEIVEKNDDICCSCPENVKAHCMADRKAAGYDRKCLEALGFAIGDMVTWEHLSKLVCSKIIADPNIRLKICGSCRWNYVCQHANVEKLSKVLKTI